MEDRSRAVERAGEALAALVRDGGLHVAVAESLTGGALTSALARAPGASEWLRGGVVAYDPSVKQDVLGVPKGVPVVSDACASALADGVAQLLDADLALAATGVGGPDPADGVPPGTVWTAVHLRGRTEPRLLVLQGDPEEVCGETCLALLERAAALLTAEPRRDRVAAASIHTGLP